MALIPDEYLSISDYIIVMQADLFATLISVIRGSRMIVFCSSRVAFNRGSEFQ